MDAGSSALVALGDRGDLADYGCCVAAIPREGSTVDRGVIECMHDGRGRSPATVAAASRESGAQSYLQLRSASLRVPFQSLSRRRMAYGRCGSSTCRPQSLRPLRVLRTP